MGISAKTGAIVFHWNISVDAKLSKDELHQWLSIWAEMIDDNFGQLYSPEATLVHAMCFMTNTCNDIDALNKQVQRFVVNDIAKYQSLTATLSVINHWGHWKPKRLKISLITTLMHIGLNTSVLMTLVSMLMSCRNGFVMRLVASLKQWLVRSGRSNKAITVNF